MTQPALNARLSAIPMAATMQAAARVRALRGAGVDVVSLTLGEPDFPTPAHAIEAAHQAALRGETRYPPVNGTAAMLEAVQAKFLRDSGLVYGADEVIVGHGARQILYDALTASLEPGSEVIIPAPYWNAYPLIARMAGGVPVFVPCAAADGYLPSPGAIEAAITPRTRWLILNFPGNPTGAVCSAARMGALAEMLARHPHLWILCDDIYEHLIHDGSANATMAAVAPALRDRVLTVSGVSKTYAMPGWRVGFAGGPARLIKAMSLMQGQSTGGVGPVAQAAAAAALNGPQDLVAAMRAAYRARGARVAAALDALPGVRCPVPLAAFYVFADVSGWLGRASPGGRVMQSDADVAAALLDEARVACVQGSAFGGPGHVRFSTAASDAALAEGCARISSFAAGMGC
jgi:aspartate aminotransferase